MQTKALKMPSTDLILISAKFRWIPEEFWESHHMQHVMANQGSCHSSIVRSPRQSRRKNAPKMSQWRWVLEDTQQQKLLAWAFLHTTQDKITQSLLAASFTKEAQQTQADLCRDAFSLLASSAIVHARCDIIRIAQTNREASTQEDLISPWEGKKESLWALPPLDNFLMNQNTPALTLVTAVAFTPQEWWATEHGTKDYADLSYLRKRQERLEAATCPTPRTPTGWRRGFWSRFFIWR